MKTTFNCKQNVACSLKKYISLESYFAMKIYY